jgi:uncharacterized membrane protein
VIGMQALLQRVQRNQRLRRLRRDGERGSISPLIIAFGATIIMLLVVVTDAAQLWVYQRGLHSIADGASLQAANALDKSSLYSEGVDDTIEIDLGLAQQAVNDYVATATASDAASSEGVTCTADLPTVTDVRVTCNGTAELPLVGFVTNGRSEIPVESEATARTFQAN